MTQPRDIPLRYGYTLDDLERLTKLATWCFTGGLDYRTRHDTAWSAIAEALYAAQRPPTPGELVSEGQTAISRHMQADMRHHGRSRHTGQGRPRFAAYWAHGYRASPEDVVVEQQALRQVWPRLTARQREALMALAAHEDYRAGAAALGVTVPVFTALISKARKRFLALWHEGEIPSRPWGRDTRAGSRTPAGQPIHTRRSVTRVIGRRRNALARRTPDPEVVS
ncbi:hypothetical protein [Streptosporangium saharense]|uniref:hypothetical protein n=1 Tax=Streptosporangium saharense TaxID=1706840 RepID=UPI00342FA7BA